ncbi:MAG: MJ0042-type zinc finger domain-containing protein, partial [Pseudomonadota bacterium]
MIETKKIQCPNCFTVYRISDEQIASSRGKVRCGHCHSQFKAIPLGDHELKNVRKRTDKANDLFATKSNG